MQEVKVFEEDKINKIFEIVSTEDFNREMFEKQIKEMTNKFKGYIATSLTLDDDKKKRAELNKFVEAQNRIRINIKNLLSETPNEWDNYAKSLINPLEEVVENFSQTIRDLEEQQRAKRLEAVKDYISQKAGEYMLDSRLFDEESQGYIKVADFKSDGVTLKKATVNYALLSSDEL